MFKERTRTGDREGMGRGMRRRHVGSEFVMKEIHSFDGSVLSSSTRSGN